MSTETTSTVQRASTGKEFHGSPLWRDLSQSQRPPPWTRLHSGWTATVWTVWTVWRVCTVWTVGLGWSSGFKCLPRESWKIVECKKQIKQQACKGYWFFLSFLSFLHLKIIRNKGTFYWSSNDLLNLLWTSLKHLSPRRYAGSHINVQNVERVFEEKWSQVMQEALQKQRPSLERVIQEVVSHFNAALQNLKSQFRKVPWQTPADTCGHLLELGAKCEGSCYESLC